MEITFDNWKWLLNGILENNDDFLVSNELNLRQLKEALNTTSNVITKLKATDRDN